MFTNNLKCYSEILWEIIHKFQLYTIQQKLCMISLSQITYFVYLDDYFISLKDYSYHISRIFCPCWWNILIYVWKIFRLHGKNFFKRFFVVHKSLAHHSHSRTHTITMLPFFIILSWDKSESINYMGFKLNANIIVW